MEPFMRKIRKHIVQNNILQEVIPSLVMNYFKIQIDHVYTSVCPHTVELLVKSDIFSCLV